LLGPLKERLFLTPSVAYRLQVHTQDRQERTFKVSKIQGTPGRKDRLIEASTHNGKNMKLVEMSEKKAIKIIKKDERVRKQKPAPKGNTTAQTAREMVQTVTNWVNELQQKRRVETATAIKLMLPENPRTSEA
jgi:hypothetical protein